jgi:hypothetical protein
MRFCSLRTAILFGSFALALMANGRKPIAAAQLAPPRASPNVALSASPASAQAGQPVTLTWSSTDATSITLEPSVGRVAAQGSTTVKPSQSTTYTVTATGPGGSAHASAQVTISPAPAPAAVQKPSQEEISSDQRQMRGLDEQIQEIKSDALRMSAELSQLEEKLLYPSGTQVAIFVELAKGDTMRLDAVRLQIDGQLVAHYIYSAKELQALRKGGVQRIYVGNVATGDHKLDVLVDGKLEGGADFNRTGQFTFRKDVQPKLVGLTLAGPRSGSTPITLGDW